MAPLNRLRRPRFQFGLRALFCAVFFVAVGLTVWLQYIGPFKEQRQGINVLQELGVFVSTRAADGPDWQRWLVGEDDFVEVTSIQFADHSRPLPPNASRVALNERVIEALAQLRGIEHLNLTATTITDQQLQTIAAVPSIEHLHLRNTEIGDQGVQSLAKYKGLKSLDLNRTLVSDAALETVGQFEQLTYFSLNSPNVKGPGLVHIAKLQALINLQFTGANVTNEWIAAVASLPNLEWVELHSTSVDELAAEHIRRWKKLRSLYLNQNAIRVEGLADLKSDLPNLERFEAGGNRPRNAQGLEVLPNNTAPTGRP